MFTNLTNHQHTVICGNADPLHRQNESMPLYCSLSTIRTNSQPHKNILDRLGKLLYKVTAERFSPLDGIDIIGDRWEMRLLVNWQVIVDVRSYITDGAHHYRHIVTSHTSNSDSTSGLEPSAFFYLNRNNKLLMWET